MRVPAPLFVVLLAWLCTEVTGEKTPAAKINKGQEDMKITHPWTVRIVAGQDTICPGSLIDANTVLSAASCVTANRPLNAYTVILGDFDIQSKDDMEQYRKVAEVLPYPTFEPRTGRNNLVLVRLTKPAKFTVVVSPVQRLATKSEESKHIAKDDSRCAIVSWGDQIEDKSTKKTLMLSYVELQIVADSYCEELDGFVPKEHVCYMSVKGAPCNDVGAPIMCMYKNKWSQVGVHSGGKNDKCRRGFYYGVSVASVRKWIRITSLDKASKYPSYFLVSKWRTWFLMLDTTGDRTLDMEDADTAADLFAVDHELPQFNTQMALIGYRMWYNQCALNNKSRSADMTKFINEMMKQYMTDRRGFMKRADKLCMEPYFVWMDEDLDGFMTLDEFKSAFIAWNLEDDYHVARLFNYLGPSNDVLPTGTAMHFFEDFLTDDNILGKSTILRGIVIDILMSRDGVLRGQQRKAERLARKGGVGPRGERG